MFKQERVIPAVALLLFVFAVVGLIWGNQLGISGTLPPLTGIAVVFLAYMLSSYVKGLPTASGKSRGPAEWTALILGGASLAMLSYAAFVPRNSDGQQASFSCFCGGFLALFFILFALLDELRRRRQEELAGNPTDKDSRV
jgi:hypothetical protein